MASLLARMLLRGNVRSAAKRSLGIFGKRARKATARALRPASRSLARATRKIERAANLKPKRRLRITNRRFKPTRRKTSTPRTPRTIPKTPNTSTIQRKRSVKMAPKFKRAGGAAMAYTAVPTTPNTSGIKRVPSISEFDTSSSITNPNLYESMPSSSSSSRSLLSRTRALMTKKNLKRAGLVGGVAGGAAITAGAIAGGTQDQKKGSSPEVTSIVIGDKT